MAQEAGQGQILTATRGPWTGGYTSSVPGFMARPDQLIGNTDGTDTNSSRDVNIDPFTGGVSRRAGSSRLNDANGDGILNFAMTAKCRKMVPISSPAFGSGYPSIAALWGKDTNGAFPTGDVGFQGTIWLNNIASGASTDAKKNYNLLEDFVIDTTYGRNLATKVTNADYTMKVVPWCTESGDGVYMRGAPIGSDKFHQSFPCAGSRGFLQTQNWLYSPNLRCTPWRWNKNFNNNGSGESATTRVLRIFPTGPFGPLFPPTLTTPSADTSATAWSDGDTFYLSVAFVRDDGSPSAPFIPQAANPIATTGRGLVTVGTIGSSAKYRYVTYTNIPIGPDGTTKRVLLRTVKQNRTANTDNVTLAPLDLRIIGVLNNNTQTSYVDYGGDDSSLLEDDDFVAVDWVCPRRARYIGTGDSRAIISYTLPNTAAIMLAPVAINNGTTYDYNAADTGSVYAASATWVRLTSTDLELHYQNGTSAASYATANSTATVASMTSGGGNAVKFPYATFTTVQSMVDAINNTDITVNCRMWRAQLAPGIDPTMNSSDLTKTTLDIACTTANGFTTVTSAALFGSVGVGMKVYGTSIPADNYVASKTSASSIELKTAAANPGTGAVTLTFASFTGDTESITVGGNASYGYIRAFCAAWPVLLHLKPSAFPGYDVPDKQSVYFTNASPGAASSGISLAPDSYTAANRRVPPPSPNPLLNRVAMGIVDIEGAGLIAYNNGIYMFANQRGANTGEDFDCRLFDINNTRGCISYLGLCSGNGWAAYATTEGIVVTDKNRREFCISGDIFNPTELVGDLAYEITQSAASAAADTDNQYLGLNVRGSKLIATMRNTANTTPREIAYNFSPGVEASGVEQLLSPDTRTAYIWSPPAVSYDTNVAAAGYSIGAIGSIFSSISNTEGRFDYVSYDGYTGSVGDGLILRVGTGTTDSGFAAVAYANAAPFIAGEFMALLPQDVEIAHLHTASASGVSQLEFANDQTPTFSTTTYARALPVISGKTQFQKQTVPIDEQQRGKTDLFWARWRSTEQSVTPRVWWMRLRYTECEAGVMGSNTPGA